MHRTIVPSLLLALAAVLLRPVQTRAVILYSTPTLNTDVPGSLTNRDPWTGPQGADDPRRLLDSGWQYQGSWGAFLGTPIASQFFVTANHVGGTIGDTFTYNGVTYTTTNSWAHRVDPNDPNSDLLSDLRIWKVSGTFNTYAPMYNAAANVDGSEVGKSMVVIGRGTERGDPVMVGNQLKGWLWGGNSGVQSWGENVVTSWSDFYSNNDHKLMSFDFDSNAGPNEATLSAGDSGGGVFINSGGVWKLAGINFAVDGPFRYSANGADFTAAISDASGLYAQLNTAGDWQLIPTGVIAGSYATRISSELSWIQSIIGANSSVSLVPEPAGLILIPLLLVGLARRR